MSAAAPLVAHVVYRFGTGGLENGIVNLVNRLPRERWQHAIVSLTDVSSEFAKRIERTDVRYVALEKGPGHLLPLYPRLARLFRELRPAVVHTRNLAALEASVPAWAAGVPVRIHGEHGWDMQDPRGSKKRYRVVRRLYRPFVHRYVALSRHLAGYLKDQVGVRSDDVSQIYNGVDTERFHPAETRTPVPGCPFTRSDEWVVGTVGRMEAVKDPLNLARAFVLALKASPVAMRHMRLVFVGDGALRAEAQRLIDIAGLTDRVWFAGERADVPQLMRSFDCFALPSLAEGVSNTILEAMATQLPIVATRVGGNAELIESEMTGLLVPPANPQMLADALLRYFRGRAMARRHAKAARRVVVERFSLARMVADYGALYENALSSAGVAVPDADEALAPR